MPPIPLARALEAERRAIVERQSVGERGDIGDPGLSAICLSGGGIRSASFALGVIQGLGRRGLLDRFDYLSTVSGGGFTGGWLMAWLHHGAAEGDPRRAFEQLAGGILPDGEIEAPPISRMREYSRYMSPRMGALSADSWTLAATMLRNVVLNWMVLLPLLAAALLVPSAYLEAVQYVDQASQGAGSLWRHWGAVVLLVSSLVLLAISLAFIALNLPSYGNRRNTQADFLTRCLTPLGLGALGLTLFWADYSVVPRLERMIAGAVAANVLVWAVMGLAAGQRRWRPRIWVAAAASAPVTGAGLWWLMGGPFGSGVSLDRFYCTAALPAILGLCALQTTMFVAVAGPEQTEADLEWHSRLLGWLCITILVWFIGASLVFYAPPVLRAIAGALERQLHMAHGHGAGLLGSAGALVGGALTHLFRRMDGSAASKPSTVRRAALAIVPAAFVTVLLGGLAWTNVTMMRLLASRPELAEMRVTPLGHDVDDVTDAEVLAVAALLVGLGAAAARFVPVNRFSLHGMYRQRLIRAFLGASRSPAERRPNPFTGFDERDNLAMHALAGSPGPLLVVNATLNRVAGRGLAMQFRKAESFTMTPLHCGSAMLDAFRPTAAYGDESRGAAGGTKGISLGTALAISGAAASPNMGARSSPALTFLMTLFNARLGVWLGNPAPSGERTWTTNEPGLGVGPIVREMFGGTTDRDPYVYLSDGGHFENLGLWSMVLRRCRRIFVCDAGADPDYTFDDLANAVRLIRIDHGVPIEFDEGFQIGPQGREGGNRTFAVGRIRYSAVDGPEAPDGVLIYLKATLTGAEPVDVTNYARAHPAFPHESTAEQWFTEAQFESYRMLGLTAVAQVAPQVRDDLRLFFGQ
jgi:hypothetical protein